MSITIILVLGFYFIVCLLLMGIILIQAGKGGGLSSLGSASNQISDRLGSTSAERHLMYATWVIAFGFIVMAFGLAIWGSEASNTTEAFREGGVAPAPVTAGTPLPPATTPIPTQPGVAPPVAPGGIDPEFPPGILPTLPTPPGPVTGPPINLPPVATPPA
jgi:preprotein translocase subunit SecG